MVEGQTEWWFYVLPTAAIVIATVTWLIWTIAERRSLVGRVDRMKRGVKFWAEPLPVDIKSFLQCIPNDSTYESSGAFLKKRDNIVLIQPYSTLLRWKVMGIRRPYYFPYVAYIDLCTKKAKIQYRAPISGVLFFALWIIAGICLSLLYIWRLGIMMVIVGAGALWGNHDVQRETVFEFIRKQMQSYYTRK